MKKSTRSVAEVSGNDSIEVSDLAAFFEGILAQPPSEAGKRLYSARDLALRLKIHHRKIQRAFDLLVERGILVSRHGSGTYIRKVPSILQEKSARPSWLEKPVNARDILAGPGKALIRNQAPAKPRQLRLVVLIGERKKMLPHSFFLQGVRDRVKGENHDLKLCSVEEGETLEETAKKLRSLRCDGVLLPTAYVPIFNLAFKEHSVPVVFIGSETREEDMQSSPLVRIDIEEAMIRSMHLFARDGAKRIGMISLYSPNHPNGSLNTYENTLKQLKLPFRSFEAIRLNEKSADEAVRRMFGSDSRPEAVYVSDDYILKLVAPIWAELGIVPGQNLRVITLSNRGVPLPAGFEWSRMEFNSFQVGRMAADSLLLEIQTAGEEVCSFGHFAEWLPGKTHLSPAI